MHELYVIAIFVIGICAACFYFMGVEIGKLITEIKVLRHDLNLDKRDYKCLLELQEDK